MSLNDVWRGELITLIGVEGLGLMTSGHIHPKGLQAELRVNAFGELPAEHVTRE
jgi:hypothetical protein